MIGTPGEDIAWEATEEYTTRSQMNSPRPSPAPLSERKKRPSSGTQPAVESPLRKMSFPFNERRSDDVIADDGTTIHVDPPEMRYSKITGGGPVDNAMDFGPRAGNTGDEGGWYEERGE